VELIVAVGGDGTVNEVVNGFFENGRIINELAILGVLASGTGCDFRRTFGIPADRDGQIDHLARGTARPIDIGKVTFIDFEGKETIRYFANIASFGLSGAGDQTISRLTFAKRFGGKLAFKWGIFKTMLTYRNQRVRIRVDDAFDDVFEVNTAAVCNGQYFGGSMRMAPDAEPDDGLFDVVIVADTTLFSVIRDSNQIYRGTHIESDNVTTTRGQTVVATAEPGAGDVLLDIDGEAPGILPATFEILPRAIQIRA